MSGYAYLFVRRLGAPVGPIHFGHVGWAFTYPDDDLNHRGGKHYFGMCGSTENTSGKPRQPAGRTDFWARIVPSAEAMFGFMRHVPIPRPPAAYDSYKVLEVEKPDVAAAAAAVRQVRAMEYRAAAFFPLNPRDFWRGSNCLDHAYRVLTAYGLVTPFTPQTAPLPNTFFDTIDAPERPLPPEAGHSAHPQHAGAHPG